MLFIDGLGLPPTPLGESIYAHCPVLTKLLSNHCVPLDANLGVPGLPQSATGQTTIFTGVNAAALLGEHLPGFPNPRLRSLIREHNLFTLLQAQKRSCTFADAYVRLPGSQLSPHLQSVTTVATLAAFGQTRTRDDLLSGSAVYHDLTRQSLLGKEYAAGIPCIPETTAAAHLAKIARSVDFSLFEYFLTDWAGHRGTRAQKQAVLTSLDTFLESLLREMDIQKNLLLIVSDHGNIEFEEKRGHSNNPVPWIAYGRGAEKVLSACSSLTDVTPAILNLYSLN
jgi:hypothetical protein